MEFGDKFEQYHSKEAPTKQFVLNRHIQAEKWSQKK